MNAETIVCRILALENASEMIRGHGEEGGQEQEDYDVDLDVYFKQCDYVADLLQKKANALRSKYTIKED